MPAAARITDMHTCPLTEPSTGSPHIGGPISGPGASSVLIGGLPAAVSGDMAICTGGSPDTLSQGSGTVYFENKPAVRQGDITAHGGTVSVGFSMVIIGG